MKKRDIFTFYILGFISPWIFGVLWVILWAIISIFSLVLGGSGFFFVVLLGPLFGLFLGIIINKKAIKNYKEKGGNLPSRALNIVSFFWWLFSCSIITTFLLGELSRPVSPNYTSAVKNALVNGIKECVVKSTFDESTNFLDAISFSGKYRKFKIEPLDANSCYEAKAVPTNDKFTWFEIDYDPETGKVSKTCGDSLKLGCEKGNTW